MIAFGRGPIYYAYPGQFGVQAGAILCSPVDSHGYMLGAGEGLTPFDTVTLASSQADALPTWGDNLLWSPDGATVYSVRQESDKSATVWKVDVATNTLSTVVGGITVPTGAYSKNVGWCGLSPDGSTLYFVVGTRDGSNPFPIVYTSYLFAVDLATGAYSSVSWTGVQSIDAMAVSPDGTRAFTYGVSNSAGVWLQSVLLPSLTLDWSATAPGNGGWSRMTVSPDSKELWIGVVNGSNNGWVVVDTATGVVTRYVSGISSRGYTCDEAAPLFSPDGQTVYLSLRSLTSGDPPAIGEVSVRLKTLQSLSVCDDVLTDATELISNFAWSVEGTLFGTVHNGRGSVYFRSVVGSGVHVVGGASNS